MSVRDVWLPARWLFRGHGSKSSSNTRLQAIVWNMLRQTRMDQSLKNENTAKQEFFLREKCVQSFHFTCHSAIRSPGHCVGQCVCEGERKK